MTHGNDSKKNFEIYTPEEFITAIAQHIPEKSFQMVRYYGGYSNKSRGIRNKQGIERSSHEPVAEPDKDIEITDVSDYQPPRIPSKSWRDWIPPQTEDTNRQWIFWNKTCEKSSKLGAGAYVKKPFLLEKIGLAVRDELER